MVSFSDLDIWVIVGFLALVAIVGFLPTLKKKDSAEDFLLSGRKVGLFLFILTNVATWYGGILGVGEFTYHYGIASWFTQGLPYYIFAIIFAFLFAPKIREASMFTIPDKLEETYGTLVGRMAALLIFILVSPAPYLLMVGSLINLIFGFPMWLSLILGLIISVAYLFKGGYKADLLTDALEFFVMFIGFIVIVVVASGEYGGFAFLEETLPASHLELTGGASPIFILVWFLIALWTFTDPGFHQRCYAAKNGKVAKYGIIISVFLWALFDFLTTTTGLYARSIIPDMSNPVLAFPLLAEKILGPGLKGVFYAALFATILSTLNSFLFLSATTFGRDLLARIKGAGENKIPKYTKIGLIVTSVISVVMAISIESVIGLWYTIGTICIPGLIVLVVGAYYPKYSVSGKFALIELIVALSLSISWLLLRNYYFESGILLEIEPMIIGLAGALIIHFIGVKRNPA